MILGGKRSCKLSVTEDSEAFSTNPEEGAEVVKTHKPASQELQKHHIGACCLATRSVQSACNFTMLSTIFPHLQAHSSLFFTLEAMSSGHMTATSPVHANTVTQWLLATRPLAAS